MASSFFAGGGHRLKQTVTEATPKTYNKNQLNEAALATVNPTKDTKGDPLDITNRAPVVSQDVRDSQQALRNAKTAEEYTQAAIRYQASLLADINHGIDRTSKETDDIIKRWNNLAAADADAFRADWNATRAEVDRLDKEIAALEAQMSVANRGVGYGMESAAFLQQKQAANQQLEDLKAQRQAARELAEQQRLDMLAVERWTEQKKYDDLREQENFRQTVESGKSLEADLSEEEIRAQIAQLAVKIDPLVSSGLHEEAEETRRQMGLLYARLDRMGYLTNEEKELYYYLYAKDTETGGNAAEAYSDFMQDPINARKGAEQARDIMEEESDFIRAIRTGAYGFGAGLDQWATGVGNLSDMVNGEETVKPTTARQYGSSIIREGLGEQGFKIPGTGNTSAQTLYDLATTAGQALPMMLTSKFLSPAVGMAMTGSSAMGNAYGESISQGYSGKEAFPYAVAVGASEALLERMLSGIGGMTGKLTGKVTQSVVDNINKAVPRVLAKIGVKSVSEGVEEYLQAILEPVYRNLLLGENNEVNLLSEDAVYSYLLGSLSSLALDAPANTVQLVRAGAQQIHDSRINRAAKRWENYMGQPPTQTETPAQVAPTQQEAPVQTAAPDIEQTTATPQEHLNHAAEMTFAADPNRQTPGVYVATAGDGVDIYRISGGKFVLEQNGQILNETPIDRLADAKRIAKNPALLVQEAQENAPAVEAEAEHNLPKISMEDFVSTDSPVWRNVALDDQQTMNAITQTTHQNMVDSGAVVQIPEHTSTKVQGYYPDLRGMKKQERTPILKQKITELKTELRKFLNGLKNATFEFEVNGNILDAKLYDTGVKEVMEKITQDKASMLLHSDAVFQNAQYLYSTPDYDGDPNVYRWNYFYTPVQIGDSVVGVRIAVRDMVRSTDGGMDSQIYNWNIKKEQPWAVEGGSVSSDTTDASSVVPNDSIAEPAEIVNAPGQETIGDMGAKTSDFPHEVKETGSRTLHTIRDALNVPEDQRQTIMYDAITEKESLHNAALRLETDYIGEITELGNKTAWTGEDMDVAKMILADLRADAAETGNWSDYLAWEAVFNAHKTTAAQALQSLAKYSRMSGGEIVAGAADVLNDSKTGTDKDAVMETVSDYAALFDEAVKNENIDGLVQIIRETAGTRKTGSLFRNKIPKEINWAINRVAEMARQEQVTGREAAQQPAKQFAVGDVVLATDRGNYGKIQSVNADGTYDVHFTERSGHTATKTFAAEELQDPNRSSGTLMDATGGTAYEFLKAFAAAGIESIAADTKAVSFGDAVKTIRYNAMLSKFSTTMRNLVGNEVLDGMDTLARDISVPLDILLSKFTGTRSIAFDQGAFSKVKQKASMDALAMALMEVGLDVNASGATNKYEGTSSRTFKASGGLAARVLSAWEKWTAYNMNVTDEFKKGGIAAEVQRGVDRLYEQGKIKDDSLRDAGQQAARYRTFQDDTALSKAMTGIRSAANNIYGLGDFAMPFAKVPANLPMRAIEYSPAGFAVAGKQIGEAIIAAKKGEFTAAQQAKLVQSVGRAVTGTTLIAAFAAAAIKGIIHVVAPGGEEENKDKAALEKAQGLNGTQFNVSAFIRGLQGGNTEFQNGDTLLSIGFLDPLNAHMTTAALIAEDIQNDELTFENLVKNSFSGIMQSVLELPVMGVLKDAANAFQYSDEETWGGKAIDAATQYLAGQATSWIPNSLKGIAQGLDDTQRDAYTADTTGGQLWDNIKASIPGLRNTLPAKLDPFGNEIKNEGGWLNFLNTNILPGQITTYKTNETIDHLNELSEQTGNASVYADRKAPTYVTVDGKNVELTREQQTEFQTTRGQTEFETKQGLKDNDIYQGFNNDMKLDAMALAEKYAKETARADLGVGYEPEAWVKDLEGASPEEVMDAVISRTVDNILGDGEQRYDNLGDMLDNGTINDSIALSVLPTSAVTKYEAAGKGAGVTVTQFVDSYGVYQSMEGEDRKDQFLQYVKTADLSTAQRVGLAKSYYKELPTEWLIGINAPPAEIVNSLTGGRKTNWNTYIKGSGISVQQYWRIAEHCDDITGQDRKDKVTSYINSLSLSDAQKTALFRSEYPKSDKVPKWD